MKNAKLLAYRMRVRGMRKDGTRDRHFPLRIALMLSVVGVASYFAWTGRDDVDSSLHGRRLSGGGDCTKTEDIFGAGDEKYGWLVLLLLLMIHTFIGLAIVCDEYFVESLEKISEALDLSEDVAGATFMAAGSSAPELATSMLGSFVLESDVGVGTIVGSAVFNIVVIIGLSGAMAGAPLDIDWFPLARDCIFYSLSVILMLVFFINSSREVQDEDGSIEEKGLIAWWEGFTLVMLYVCYTVFMRANKVVQDWAYRKFGSKVQPEYEKGDGDEELNDKVGNPEGEELVIPKAEGADDDEDDKPWYALPGEGFAKDALHVISFPYLAMFFFTIPDSNSEKLGGKMYLVAFTMSIVYIGSLSFAMVWAAEHVGCILGISQVVMGVTILAAGTSVPDALSSVVVAKDGQGNMAVANAIGSNVFDICLGLGLPWFLKTLVDGEDIEVGKDSLVLYTLILFGVLLVVVAGIAFDKWRLRPKMGALFMFVYVLFIIFSVVYAATSE